MSRGDLLGLLLVLLVGVGGLSWVALERAGARRAADAEAQAERWTAAPPSSARAPVELAVGEPDDGATARRGPWTRWNREAIDALEAGDHARAIELLERCHAEVPEEPVFALNLAEALARLARVERADRELRAGAIERLARAVELAPDREDLAEELARWRALEAAEEGFWTDESAHFQLTYDGARGELLERGYSALLEVLEAAYLEFGELFGSFPVEAGRPKIQVVIYRRDAFDALTGIGDWAGGVFDGVVRIPLEDLAREQAVLSRVLRHELVHAFVEAVGGRDVPGWLNEGLAQWLEERAAARRQSAAGRARERLRGKRLFALDELQGSLASWTDPAGIEVAYAQSLAFCDFVARFYGERLLFEMVAGCAAGRAPGETFRARLQVDLGLALQDLAAEIERG